MAIAYLRSLVPAPLRVLSSARPPASRAAPAPPAATPGTAGGRAGDRTRSGRPTRAAPITEPHSGSEELDEARLDLLVALFQLLRVHVEEVQIGELRPVGRILHLGMSRVEPFAVRQRLLGGAAEDEVGEQLGRVRMRREAGDGGGGDDERDAFLRVHDLDRVALLLDLVERVVAAVHRDGPLAGGDDARGI